MNLWRDASCEYSRSARGLIFTAGSCPLDVNGEVVALGDLVGQAERALENLLTALGEAGVSPDAVLKTTVYVAADARSALAVVWDVVSPHLGHAPSTPLGVSFPEYPGQLVEIEAIAAAHP